MYECQMSHKEILDKEASFADLSGNAGRHTQQGTNTGPKAPTIAYGGIIVVKLTGTHLEERKRPPPLRQGSPNGLY